jgi:hypothetical protein
MVSIFNLSYSLQQWQQIGIFDVMLPFMLIFAILFAILQKTNIFGGRKGIDAIVAMAMAFMAIINPFVTDLMKVILQNAVIAILLMVAIMLLFGLILGSKKPKIWHLFGWVTGLIILVWLVGRVADYYELYYPGTVVFSTMWWNNNLPWMIPIFIIIIFAIVVVSSGKDKTAGGNDLSKILNVLTEKDTDGW